VVQVLEVLLHQVEDQKVGPFPTHDVAEFASIVGNLDVPVGELLVSVHHGPETPDAYLGDSSRAQHHHIGGGQGPLVPLLGAVCLRLTSMARIRSLIQDGS